MKTFYTENFLILKCMGPNLNPLFSANVIPEDFDLYTVLYHEGSATQFLLFHSTTWVIIESYFQFELLIQ